jgi:hypothetical protein
MICIDRDKQESRELDNTLGTSCLENKEYVFMFSTEMTAFAKELQQPALYNCAK